MKVLGVATTNPLDLLRDCDLAVDSLAEVTPDILAGLLESSPR